jgi:hypothetical protein
MNFQLLASLSKVNKSCAALVRALALSVSTVFATTGCASFGTVIVEYDHSIDVIARNDAGKELWRARPDQIVPVTRHPAAGNPFSVPEFVAPDFRWRVIAGCASLDGSIVSTTNAPVCLRFDQASISSNFQATPKYLHKPPGGGKGLIGDDSGHEDARKALLASEAAKGKKVLPPTGRWPGWPVACAPALGRFFFGYTVNLSELFPTARLFNVNQTGKNLNYSERGVGNWLKITVPVEYAGKREILEMTVTGKDSRARMSYH